jgi:hypothetical protein
MRSRTRREQDELHTLCPLLRGLVLLWAVALWPLCLARAQVEIIGTGASSGSLQGYVLTRNQTSVRVTSVGTLTPNSGSGHLVGNFTGDSKQELLRVQKTSEDTFSFSTESSNAPVKSQTLRLSRKIGSAFYLLSGFNLDKNPSEDLAIIDLSRHHYWWTIVLNPLDDSRREHSTFRHGFATDRVEWTQSPEHGVEFVAVRQRIDTRRTRVLLRSADSGARRIVRFEWNEPRGLLIPLRLQPSRHYDPDIALYAPAVHQVLLTTKHHRVAALQLPQQRCAGYQAISDIDKDNSVATLEICPDGSFFLAKRDKSEQESVLTTGALPESLANLRRVDHTRVQGDGAQGSAAEVPVPIIAPGASGAELIQPNPVRLVLPPAPTSTPEPIPPTPAPPTATPIVATVTLAAPPSAVSTARTLSSAVVGSNASEWRYMFGQDEFDCSAQSSWSSWSSIATPLSLDLGYPRQKVLCLQGRIDTVSDGGPIQEYKWDLAFEHNINISAATNFSLETPLIAAVSDSSDARSRLSDGCIDYRGNSSVTIGSAIHFQTICHHPSAGWSLCLATWDGTAPNASWVDSAPATAGFQPHWSKCSKSSDNVNFLGNLFKYSFTALADGRVFGTFNGSGGGCGPRLTGSGFHPVVAPSISSMTATHTLAGFHNWAQPIQAGTWRESYDRYGSWVNSDESDNIWVYNTSRDSAGRAYLSAVDLTASNYTATASAPSDYLVADYASGMVRRKNSTYHFIGYHTVRQRWEHVLGRSPTDFAWDNPTDLGLVSMLSTPGKWFSGTALQAPTCSAGPYIHTFEVLTDSSGSTNLFIFFRAGDLATQTATSVRGIGAIKIPLS